jgi:hypothetical protein
MINHAGLPQNRWEEAVDHAVWIRNRVKTARLNNITPFEAYFKIKPDMRHLHPFGCLAHALIPKDTRDRVFDPVTRRCIFVGFSKRFNAFRLFDIEQKKEINSRDVIFFDDTFPLNKDPFVKQVITPETSQLHKENPTEHFNISGKSLRSYAPNMESTEIYKDHVTNISPSPSGPTTSPITNTRSPSPIPTRNSNPTPTTFARSPSPTPTRNPTPPPSLPTREETPPLILDYILAYVLDHMADTPNTLEEALASASKTQWWDGLTKEYSGIQRLNVFRKPTPEELKVLQQENPKIFQNHNIFKLKKDESGEIARWKVRLVLQGCFMKQGIHYDQTFSPCTRLETIRLMVAIAVQKGWKMTHADVPNAYLHGSMDRLVFTHLPLHWNKINGDSLGKDGDPVVLSKALYGAPNAGRAWNQVIDRYLKSLGYKPSPNETALYVHEKGTIIALWVDDIFITGPDTDHINHTLESLKAEYDVKTLGQVSYALGIHFQPQADGSFFMSQTAMIDDIVKTMGMEHANTANSPLPNGYKATKDDCPRNVAEIEDMTKIPYRSNIGKLLYVAMATRPDIMYAVISLSRFSNNPGKVHWSHLKNIVKYLKTTRTWGLHYKPTSNTGTLNSFTDASYNSDPDTGRSTLGYDLDYNGCCWLWYSALSKTIPKSATHAEIVAASKCLDSTRWATHLLNHMKINFQIPVPFHMDSESAIYTMTNPHCTKEARFLKPKYFDLREEAEQGYINFVPLSTNLLNADALTKALIGQKFERHRASLCVAPSPESSIKRKAIHTSSLGHGMAPS